MPARRAALQSKLPHHLHTGALMNAGLRHVCCCFLLQGAPAQTKVVADANFVCRESQVGESGVRSCIDSTCELRASRRGGRGSWADRWEGKLG